MQDPQKNIHETILLLENDYLDSYIISKINQAISDINEYKRVNFKHIASLKNFLQLTIIPEAIQIEKDHGSYKPNIDLLLDSHIAKLIACLKHLWYKSKNKKTETPNFFKLDNLKFHYISSKEDIALVATVFKKAITLMKSSDIPNINSILYGDVIIADHIGTESQAIYRDDKIYYRNTHKIEPHYIRTLIHEFGHRYYNLVLKNKRLVKKYYNQIKRSKNKPISYLIGKSYYDIFKEPLFFRNGDGLLPGEDIILSVEDIGGGILKLDMGKVHITIPNTFLDNLRFPSLYASKDSEEFFCEVFSLYCVGKLEDTSLVKILKKAIE